VIYGSSLKLCKIAEGEIDIYPRLIGIKEWDADATDILSAEASC
jgi:3'(2'), 5'-bisphosphate nucleotidase